MTLAAHLSLPTYTVARVTRASGANGFPAIWYRWTIEADGHPLLDKLGRVRTWGSSAAAWKVAAALAA